MLDRRRFLRLAGLSGLSLAGIPWLGCDNPETTDPGTTTTTTTEGIKPDPLPDDPNKAWWLRQDYAPVDESEAFDLEIVGALPPSLTGLYLRNGPNPMSGDTGHWFLGDGMVHGVMLEKGKAPWYRARYIQTELLGKGDVKPVGPPTLTGHHANTSVVHHGGKVFCLEEVGLPYEVSAKDLSTIGTYDYAGKLMTAMTAHPKIDPVTGDIYFFAYGLTGYFFTYHRANAKGELLSSEQIDLPAAVMMHDFQLTETHAIFMDLPILLDFQAAVNGSPFPFRWAPENGARIGVMPRDGTSVDLKWHEIDPCFVFHTWNAFHDANDPAIIHLDCVRYPTMWEKNPGDYAEAVPPSRFSIDTAKSQVKLASLGDIPVEFPRINPTRQGRSYRYGYSIGSPPPKGDIMVVGVPPPDKIVKYDWQTGNSQVLQLPEGQELDEAFFVADAGAKNEDDGWLLAYLFDRSDNRSRLLVVDATTMKEVARVKLPHRVPHGFHGDFVPTT
jgi:carotenoid cleavage dioxygenase-like enzyme